MDGNTCKIDEPDAKVVALATYRRTSRDDEPSPPTCPSAAWPPQKFMRVRAVAHAANYACVLAA